MILFDQVEDGIGLVTLNRPERLNSINERWIAELHQVLDGISANRAIRVVVITGAGRGFCSGADVSGDNSDLGARTPRDLMEGQERLSSLFERLTKLRQPVIAAINGPAAGAGLALALCADIRIASENATFHVANSRMGLSAGECGISWLFPRLVGLSRCFELLLTGRAFDAAEAERMGLLSRITPSEALMEEAFALARAIAANAPFGVAMSKEVVWSNLGAPDLHAALMLENRTQALCALGGDVDEAMLAFQEKRAPRFAG